MTKSPIVLTLSTPNGLAVESVTVPADGAVIGLHVIRFANQHGISAAMVRHCAFPSVTPELIAA